MFGFGKKKEKEPEEELEKEPWEEEKKEEKMTELTTFPLKKIKGKIPVINKDQKYIKKDKPEIDELRERVKQEKPDMKRIQYLVDRIYKEKYKGEKIQDTIKQPALILLRGENQAEIFEGAKAGKLKITRTDGKTGYIQLDKNKLFDMEWGEDKLSMWIADERETEAYPTDILHDTATLWQLFQEIITNRKNLDAMTINAWEKLIGTIAIFVIIGIAVVFIGLPMFGVNILEDKSGKVTTEDKQVLYAEQGFAIVNIGGTATRIELKPDQGLPEAIKEYELRMKQKAEAEKNAQKQA